MTDTQIDINNKLLNKALIRIVKYNIELLGEQLTVKESLTRDQIKDIIYEFINGKTTVKIIEQSDVNYNDAPINNFEQSEYFEQSADTDNNINEKRNIICEDVELTIDGETNLYSVETATKFIWFAIGGQNTVIGKVEKGKAEPLTFNEIRYCRKMKYPLGKQVPSPFMTDTKNGGNPIAKLKIKGI